MAQSRSLSSVVGRGLVELRQYTLKPEGATAYLNLCAETADVRKRFLPFLGMLTPETGGALNKVLHFYAYKDFDHRDAARKDIASQREWQQFIAASRPHVLGPQESKILKEADQIYRELGLPRTADFTSPPRGNTTAIYEVREYLLHPGYGTVPKVLDAFCKGLPHKVAVDAEGTLAFFGYTDVGLLNNVYEIWRYPSAQACIRAREAARTVQQWKECIAVVTPHVQWFQSTFTVPTPFSPWQ